MDIGQWTFVTWISFLFFLEGFLVVHLGFVPLLLGLDLGQSTALSVRVCFANHIEIFTRFVKVVTWISQSFHVFVMVLHN